MPHAYTEGQFVEQPAIGLFTALGWRTVSALEETFGPGGTLGRKTSQPIQRDWRILHPPARFGRLRQWPVLGGGGAKEARRADASHLRRKLHPLQAPPPHGGKPAR